MAPAAQLSVASVTAEMKLLSLLLVVLFCNMLALLQAVACQLPHLEWNDAIPPILSFYSYAAAELVATE